MPAFPPLFTGRARDRRPRWRTEDVIPGGRLFARGRFALLEGLRALARVRGVRRLWVPAYMCRPVIDVARALDLATALYDVDARLEPVWDTVAPARGDALLVLHYFGLALAPTPVQAFCRAHDMPLVEDCAHTVPDPSAAARVGYYGDLAMFSLRKQAPVPGGGLLVVRDPEVRAAVRAPERAGPGDRRTLAKLAIMLAERVAFTLDYNILALKDRLPVLDAHPAADGLSAASARPEEGLLRARPAPPAIVLGPLLARLDWRVQIRTRQVAYRRLAARLADAPGVKLPVSVLSPGSVPQAMPVLVREPERVVRVLRARGVEAMRWPGREQIPFDPAACPGTVRWLERSLILPLGCALTPRRIDAVVRAVGEADGLAAPPSRAGR